MAYETDPCDPIEVLAVMSTFRILMLESSLVGVNSPEGCPNPGDRKVSRFEAGRDFQSRAVEFMVRWASKQKTWRLQTMEVLVQSETEGIRLLEAALPAIGDDRLRKLVEQHLIDERRHAMGFAARFESLQKHAGIDPPRPVMSPGTQRMTLTLMELFAYLEVQELRGGQVLGVYRDLFVGDEESIAFIDSVVTDEKFHATYTHLQLERWVEEGLVEEVKSAREVARRIDRSAFRSQLASFARALPRLLSQGALPPIFSMSSRNAD